MQNQSTTDNFKNAGDFMKKAAEIYKNSLQSIESQLSKTEFDGKNDIMNIIENAKTYAKNMDSNGLLSSMAELEKIINK